jgi:hypothetical protein
VELGGNPKSLPYCFAGGNFVRHEQLQAVIAKHKRLSLLLTKNYKDTLDVAEIKGCVGSNIRPDVAVLWWDLGTRATLFDDDFGRELVHKDGGQVELTDFNDYIRKDVEAAAELIDRSPSFCVERLQIFNVDFYRPPPRRWVLTIGSKDTA